MECPFTADYIAKFNELSFYDNSFDELLAPLYRKLGTASVPAIYCEHRFIKFARKQEEPLSNDWDGLNSVMQKYSLPEVTPWDFPAPQSTDDSTPALKLNCQLTAISELVSQSKVDEAKALVTSPILAHAFLRKLIVAKKLEEIKKATMDFRYPSVWRSILTIATFLLGDAATPLAHAVALSPSAEGSQELTYQAIKTILKNPLKDSGEVIFRATFALEHSGYGVDEGNPRHLWRKAYRQIRMPACSDEYIIEKVCSGEKLCPEDMLAALELTKRRPEAIDDKVFERFLMQILDRHPYILKDATSEDRDLILGEQSLRVMGRLLGDMDLPDEALFTICKLLSNIGLVPPPVFTLPALLNLLFSAIEEAKANPGEYWNDRNYGGYDLSPQERRAGKLGEAIRALLGNEYGKSYWDSVRAQLNEFDEEKLRQLELPEFTGGPLGTTKVDLIETLENHPPTPCARTSIWYFNAMPLAQRKAHLLANEPTAGRDNFREALDLKGADFSGEDLSNREFIWIEFDGANFRQANLENSRLVHCDMSKTDLRNANFKNTVCTKTNFIDANVRDADFRGADLTSSHYLKRKLRRCITDKNTLTD